MAFSINSFTSTYQGGTRPSQFQVQFANPTNSLADLDIPMKVMAASLPEWRLNPIPVYYFGRRVNVAGNREFGDWSVEVLNDEDFLIRNALEQWSNTINGVESNINKFNSGNPSNYKSDAIVTQFSQVGDILRTYTFVGVFPVSIGPMNLNWQAGSEVHTFQTVFAFDYFYVSSSINGSLAGGT